MFSEDSFPSVLVAGNAKAKFSSRRWLTYRLIALHLISRPSHKSVLIVLVHFNCDRGRGLVKRYRVIFTCLAIRASHIEIAHSLDTDSFLMALRRFIARRGQVKEIRSDNGTNFTSGERELRESISYCT